MRTSTARLGRLRLASGWPAGLALVVAAALTGWLLGEPAGSVAGPADSGGRPAEVDGARLLLPSAWTPTARDRRSFATVPGLPARAAIRFGAPDDVLAALGVPALRRMPRGRRTEVAAHAAWTYGAVRAGSLHSQLTVVPTTSGVLGVACSGPRWALSAALGCERAILGLALDSGDSLAATPDLPFRLALAARLRQLDRSRVANRRAMRRATGRRARLAAIDRLVTTHRAVARALAPLAVDGPSTAAVAALRDQAGAYRAIGRAVHRTWPHAFARAARRLSRGGAALRRQLRALAS